MTDLILRSATEEKVLKLSAVMDRIAAQQNCYEPNHFSETLRNNKLHVWELNCKTTLPAADLMAHFHYTGYAGVAIENGALIISTLPQDLPKVWYEPRNIDPLPV